jgi:ligand-binding sensor domain-containing protein
MRYFLCFSVLVFFSLQSIGQIDQKIGEWRSYLPYNDGRWVTQSEDKVYYSTEQALFSINKADVEDVMFKSKVEGLTDVGIRRIKYDDSNDQLLVVYDNSNIDIISDGEVYNLSNIKDNLILTGDRSINDIHFPNAESVFFAAAFGIVELNIQKLEFSSTIFTNIIVNDLTSNGNILYAATNDGVYFVNIEENSNIADFSSWSLIDSSYGILNNYEAYHVEVFDNRLYINIEHELWFEQPNGQFAPFGLDGFEDYDLRFLASGNGRLLVGAMRTDFGRVLLIEEDDSFSSGLSGCSNLISYAVEDEQGRFWYADEFGEIRWSDTATEGCHKDLLNSPTSESASDIKFQDGKLYVASGGVQDNYTPRSNRNGFYILENGIWTAYNDKNIEELEDKDFLNNFQVEPHPEDDRVFVASYYEGLLEYNPTDGTAIVYNKDNSPISNTIGDSQRERISGLDFDDNGTLWINNFGSINPLIAFTAEGNWHAFNPAGDNQLAKVVVDNNGYTWSVLGISGGGVVVHSDNGTTADPNDDETRLINSANSEIITGNINTIAVDLDGEVWVGTDQGPVIFDSGPSIFSNENRGSRRQVTQDSIPAILLETEDIRAIAFDGANRKWFGTRNGIFVQSPDAKTLEMQFNVDNSPLFDNTINTFEFDGTNGIMYIATNKGMQSYRTETLGAKNSHDRIVYAYPNPVRPDYVGSIAIKGLARDANVKITDLNGKLMYETTALGGQAIWDGKDYTGRKAATGVYYVFSTGTASFDIADSFVTKIMIIN